VWKSTCCERFWQTTSRGSRCIGRLLWLVVRTRWGCATSKQCLSRWFTCVVVVCCGSALCGSPCFAFAQDDVSDQLHRLESELGQLRDDMFASRDESSAQRHTTEITNLRQELSTVAAAVSGLQEQLTKSLATMEKLVAQGARGRRRSSTVHKSTTVPPLRLSGSPSASPPPDGSPPP